jgi:hypothetical protein
LARIIGHIRNFGAAVVLIQASTENELAAPVWIIASQR